MSLDAGTIALPATTSGLGVSHGTSVEESQADPELVPLTSVQGECVPVESPMHTNYGANLPSPPAEVSGGTCATTMASDIDMALSLPASLLRKHIALLCGLK